MEKINKHRASVEEVHIDEKLMRFIAELVQKTRQNSAIMIGASPRASLGLLRGSKAMAVIKGRDFVTPEDILELAVPILNHRIMLSPEKEMEGDTTSKVIQQLIQTMEIPR